MAKYLDPKADLTFIKVFGEQKDLLSSFLNAVLVLPNGREIISLDYITPDMVPENPTKKYAFINVKCRDSIDNTFIVEILLFWPNGLVQQEIINKYPEYFSLQAKQNDNDELRQVYCVCIINDIAFPNLKDEFYHRYIPANIDHPENTIKGFETIFLELPKFRPSSVSDKKMMVLWLRFLTEINEQTKEIPAEMLENEYLSKAVGIVEQSAYTDAQRMAYDKFWDEIVSERTLMKGYFRQGHAEGRAEGLVEGVKKGRIEATFDNARKLKQNGVPVEIIAQSLGLSVDDVESLV